MKKRFHRAGRFYRINRIFWYYHIKCEDTEQRESGSLKKKFDLYTNKAGCS